MNNLYKKIYEAINTGIQKSLILDDDVSMNYQYRKIDNSRPDMMQYYVDELLKTSDLQSYQKIIDYYKMTGIQYKPNNFERLFDIFYIIKNYKYFKLNWIDMSDTVVAITNDDDEISLDKFDKKIHTAKYIKIKNSICGHDIILSINDIQEYYKTYKYQLSIYYYQWQVKQNDASIFNDNDCIKIKENALKDYDGYEHTYHNINIDNSNYEQYEQCIKNNYPILYKCMTLSKFEYPYRCYQPAMGELWFLYRNEEFLNYLLKKIGCIGKLKIQNFSGWLCSSSEYDIKNIWSISNGRITKLYKTLEYLKFIPLYKKIN